MDRRYGDDIQAKRECQLLGVILDFGIWISDLMNRFALPFLIKLNRRRWTLNPNSTIQNPKSLLVFPGVNVRARNLG